MWEFFMSITEFVMLSSEALSLLLWIYIWNEKRLRYTRGGLIFYVAYVLYYLFVNVEGSFFFENILPAVLMLLWCFITFKEKRHLIILRFLAGIMCLAVVQLVTLELIFRFLGVENFEELRVVYTIAGITSLLISGFIYGVRTRDIKLLAKPDKVTVVILIYIVLIMLFIKYDYSRNDETYSYMYITMYVLLVIFMLYIVNGLRTKHSLEQKQLELRVSQQYEEVYKGLLVDMRRKQHDYKNQLTALYSMSGLNLEQEDMREAKKQYIERLDGRDSLDGLLLNCENPVLAGYVYTQCNEAKLKGITVSHKLIWSSRDYKIAMYEVIELLGILINNAIEYLEEQEPGLRDMRIGISGTKESISIQVSSRCEYISYKKIEKMFDEGYSTKGENRGIGLYSLKKITEKYNGQVLVKNQKESDGNWLCISINIKSP